MQLLYDRDIETPESLLEWVKETGVTLVMEERGRYPTRPLLFSEYQYDPPTIRVYRYLPMEEWLNLMCQHHVGYYGPWYCLHVAFRFYYHLEMYGLYEIERSWFQRLFGKLDTLDERAYLFAKQVLGALHSPARFDAVVEQSFRPDSMNVPQNP